MILSQKHLLAHCKQDSSNHREAYQKERLLLLHHIHNRTPYISTYFSSFIQISCDTLLLCGQILSRTHNTSFYLPPLVYK